MKIKLIYVACFLSLVVSPLLLQNCSKDKENDITPPGVITNLRAYPSDTTVTLAYTLPSDPDLRGVEVTICNTSNLPFEASAMYDSISILGLTNGTEYLFSLKSVDYSNNKSDSVTITATPVAP